MRLFASPLGLSALTALLLCLPVQAQQAAAPTAVSASPAAAATPAPLPLPISSPPGAKLRFEMDARSEDLLGLVKSFLKGFSDVPASAKGAAGTPAAASNPIEEVLRDGNLADILKDVNHVHFMVWEVPALKPPVPVLTPPVKPGKASSALVATPPAAVFTPSALDTNAFYEEAFGHEGAHRIVFTDADELKLLMVGFPDRRGFAFAVSGGGYVAVSRADGYPNAEALSAFMARITSAALRTKTGKQMMDGMTGDTKKPLR